MICPLMSKPDSDEHIRNKVINCKEKQCAWWCDEKCTMLVMADNIRYLVCLDKDNG